MRTAPDPAGLRGPVVGGLVAALAVAAHGAAGGVFPSGADFALLQAVSVLTGAVAVLVRRSGRLADAAGLLAVLGCGQYATHLLLTAHEHGTSTVRTALMAGAHVVATLLIASAIPAAERFAALAAGTLRALLGPPRAQPLPTRPAWFPGTPLLRAAGPLGAIGPRAPPVGR
ncbi:hypothetical protein [Nocardia asteroides]|uniref:hypothetical protein n=1 Tax=Nocardia asteroides TaxID=1824 RepID=UPI001E383C1D|nr:hypothetical protein [Nocardia asteroides]UGT59337.1 hypothetical protein LTT61_18875 [Nocardia asteroides]